MNRSESDIQDLFDEMCMLVTARLAEEITSRQLDRLEYLVINDATSRSLYIELMRQSDLLRTCLADDVVIGSGKRSRDLDALRESLLAQRLDSHGAAGKSVVEQLVPSAKRVSRKPDGLAVAETDESCKAQPKPPIGKYAIAAFIAVCFIGGIMWLSSWSKSPLPPANVATLTESHRAVWEDKDGRLIFIRDGKALPPQTLYLADGLAKITFDDGATVLLDARQRLTRFEIKSRSEGFLHVGKLAARADSERSKGFTVRVPGNSRVVDQSTEFGIVVDESGRSQIHVIEGAVETIHMDDKGSVVERVVLNETEAISIDPPTSSGQPHAVSSRIEWDQDTFQRILPTKTIAKAAEAHETRRGKRWSEYVTKLKADDSLVFFLADEIDVIDPERRVPGRFGERTAIYFSKPGDELVIADRPDLQLRGDLTVATWIRPERVMDQGFIQIVGKGSGDGSLNSFRNFNLFQAPMTNDMLRFHWSINEKSSRQNVFVNGDTSGLMHWHLVVGTVRNGQMHIHVNGRLAASNSLNEPIVSSDPLLIGRSQHPLIREVFRGAIDMVAVLSRGMSSQEIHEMYEAGKP